MRMRRVRIVNYRCLSDLEVEFDDITTLIGPNGAGKSSVLRALEWFFNGDRVATPTEDDVSAGAEPREIVVEVEFRDLTSEDRVALGRYAPATAGNLIVKRRWQGGADEIWVVGKAFPGFAHVRAAAAAMEKRRLYAEFREANPERDLPPARSVAEVDEALSRWETLHPDQLADTDLGASQLFSFAGQAKRRQVGERQHQVAVGQEDYLVVHGSIGVIAGAGVAGCTALPDRLRLGFPAAQAAGPG
jgi:putative ATP-dependent endonuclease of OLD family